MPRLYVCVYSCRCFFYSSLIFVIFLFCCFLCLLRSVSSAFLFLRLSVCSFQLYEWYLRFVCTARSHVRCDTYDSYFGCVMRYRHIKRLVSKHQIAIVYDWRTRMRYCTCVRICLLFRRLSAYIVHLAHIFHLYSVFYVGWSVGVWTGAFVCWSCCCYCCWLSLLFLFLFLLLLLMLLFVSRNRFSSSLFECSICVCSEHFIPFSSVYISHRSNIVQYSKMKALLLAAQITIFISISFPFLFSCCLFSSSSSYFY